MKIIKIGFGVFLLWIAILYLGSLIGHARNPIEIPTSPKVMAYGPRVTAEGYWKPDRELEGIDSSNTLRVSKLECYQDIKKCVMATTSMQVEFDSLRPIYLIPPDIELLDIYEWTKTRLVFGAVYLCAEHVYSIDLVTQYASGIWRAGSQSKEDCKEENKNLGDGIVYTLVGGGKSRELQEKAYPWFFKFAVAPLKMLSGFFY
jgi:hypothetical protein